MKNFYRDGGLVISVSALVVALVIIQGYIYTKDINVFWVSAPFVVLIGGFAIGKLIQVTRKTFQYYARIDDELESKMHMSVHSFPMSAVIIDSAGRIVWTNGKFTEEFPDCCEYGMELSNITDIPPADFFTDDGITVRYKDSVYKVFARIPDEDEAKELTLLFFKNITDITALETEKKLSQPVVILFMVDGYEELISGCLESEKAHVSVQIDKLLEDFAGQTTGVLRKNASDRFIAVIEERHLQEILRNKVEILDKAREIFVNDRLNVTMSIGIGRTGKTLKESEQFARQALEMALGRGGDQAAVKTDNGFEFYGGVSKGVERHTKVKTKQVERNTRVKARVKAHALREIIESREHVVIMGHTISDVDSLGAAIGVYCAARVLGKKAQIVLNEVTTSLRPLVECFTEEKGYTADLFIKNEEALLITNKNTLVMVVDTNRPSYTECPELLNRTDTICVFDHHRQNSEVIENPVLSYIEPYASSACEMIAEVLQYFSENIKLEPSEADCIYAGILIDTNNFMTKTGVRTFEAAAYLRRAGAEVTRVRKMLRNDMAAYKARAEAVRHAEVYRGAFAISVCPADNIESPTIVGAQAANELLNIVGIKASFVLTEYQGKIYISSRSIDEINVQLIMERVGGGGHLNVAGAQLTNCTIQEAKRMIQDTIDEMIKEGDIQE